MKCSWPFFTKKLLCEIKRVFNKSWPVLSLILFLPQLFCSSQPSKLWPDVIRQLWYSCLFFETVYSVLLVLTDIFWSFAPACLESDLPARFLISRLRPEPLLPMYTMLVKYWSFSLFFLHCGLKDHADIQIEIAAHDFILSFRPCYSQPLLSGIPCRLLTFSNSKAKFLQQVAVAVLRRLRHEEVPNIVGCVLDRILLRLNN